MDTTKKNKKILEIILILVFLIQFFLTLYFNIKLIAPHMGFDSSWIYLKSTLIWKEKALISDMWLDQTNVFFDSSMLLASLFYGITDNLFLSYGLSNSVILIGILISIYGLGKDFGFNQNTRLLCINLIICPYLINGYNCANDLGYFNNLISGPAFYNIRVLITLLIIKTYFKIRNGKKSIFPFILSLILCIISGISSGVFIIVIILLPCLLFIMEESFITNSLQGFKKKESIYIYLCVLLVYSGKIIANKLLHITAIDTSRSWTSIEKIWINFGAVIQGLMKLLGVLPVTETNISILSKEGIYRIFPLLIFFFLIVALFQSLNKQFKNINNYSPTALFCCNTVVLNFILFGLFNVQYGSSIFEERYLICTYIALVLVTGFFINQLKLDLLITKGIWIMLTIGLVGSNTISDYIYITHTNDDWEMEEIYQIVDQNDAELVYFWGDSCYITASAMRAYDTSHIYKRINDQGNYNHWGDYLYYDNNDKYTGSTILITPKNNEMVPDYIMSHYSLIKELTQVNIYLATDNPIDFKAGITSDISTDYPYTPGMITQNGSYMGSSFETNGTSGYVILGPNSPTVDGVYDFTIYYSIKNNGNAVFDIAIDNGNVQLGKTSLSSNKTKTTIENIPLENGHTLEYRVFCDENTIIDIDKIIIQKK